MRLIVSSPKYENPIEAVFGSHWTVKDAATWVARRFNYDLQDKFSLKLLDGSELVLDETQTLETALPAKVHGRYVKVELVMMGLSV